MELYKEVVVDAIRVGNPDLAPLSDKVLADLWGAFSLTTGNCFWRPCRAAELAAFRAWADWNDAVQALLKRAAGELEDRREYRARAHRARPAADFVFRKDGPLPSFPDGGHAGTPPGSDPRSRIYNVDELISAANAWCDQHGVHFKGGDRRGKINSSTIRHCRDRGLLDDAIPMKGTRWKLGYAEKHLCQLHLIRLLETRSFSYSDIDVMLHGKSLAQLLELERVELAVHHGDYGVLKDAPPLRRFGSPGWV